MLTGSRCWLFTYLLFVAVADFLVVVCVAGRYANNDVRLGRPQSSSLARIEIVTSDSSKDVRCLYFHLPFGGHRQIEVG